MESEAVALRLDGLRSRLFGAGVFALVAVAGLTWAKWWPYAHKLVHVAERHVYLGHSILDHAGKAGAAPSVARAWDFTIAYGNSIWVALVAALLIAAAVEAFLPRRWLLQTLAGDGRFGTVRGGVAALPCMMCTCCTAAIMPSLRREGVPTSQALAYWIGNPALNPAVMAFLAIVAPWQWVATRAIVGALLVFVMTAGAARLAGRSEHTHVKLEPGLDAERPLASAPLRFAKTLLRLAITLIPEYFIAVMMIGLLRGWLFPFDGSALHAGLLAAIVAAGVGTLIVIPTAGEIPILQGLQVLGVGAGVIGALLITLPAISLPSIAMVRRALTWRVTAGMAVAVALTGLAAGGLLWALGG